MRTLAVMLVMAAAMGAPAPASAVGGSGAPEAAPRSFEDRVVAFVYELFLTGKAMTRTEMARLYAPVVDYFEDADLPRARVLADKQAFYARCPERRYRLLRDTLRVTERPGRPRVYDVRFDYTFDVASPSRRSRGLGRAHFTIDLSVGGGRVTRETGSVLARW